jgi:HTH-type transcriptional regulator / antitoxin HipB
MLSPTLDLPLKTADQLRVQLRSLRKQRGLTQARLGELIGVSQARVVEIEAHPGSVNLQQIMQTLHALGVGLVISEMQGNTAVGKVPSPSQQPRARGAAILRRAAVAEPARKVQAKKGSW